MNPYNIILILLLVVYSISACFSQTNWQAKLDIELQTQINNTTTSKYNYLVILHEKADLLKANTLSTKSQKAHYVYQTLLNHAEQTQKKVLDIVKNNDSYYRSFYVTNVVSVTSDLSTLEKIAKLPEVSNIVDDSYRKMLDHIEEDEVVLPKNVAPEWGIKKILADSVWNLGIRGQGVVVGGQDTGYEWEVSPLKYKYRGLANDSINVSHDFNWHDAIREHNPFNADSINPCGYGILSPCDDNNHGTHTMGTMVGEDEENKIGVAPEAKWIACRNMERGWGKPSTYIECFEWFLAPYDLVNQNANPDAAPHVINNSWSCPESEGCNPDNWDIMDEVVRNLKLSGVFVTVSAGNSGPNCETVRTPAAMFEPSFSVGSTRITDEISNFSSRGPVSIDSSFRLKPNVTAPGQGVRSVVRGGNFREFSGTSMAGPHVAGLVALLISANPALAGKVDILENIIEQTADPLISDQDCGVYSGQSIPNAVFGYGRINAWKAVEKALTYSETCLLEGITLSKQSQIDSFPIEYFGCKIVYGDMIISGDEIKSLRGLGQIEEIKGNLYISQNDTLTSLNGLDNLKIINGDLVISNNPQLENIQDLSSLTHVNNLRIESNDILTNLEGLGNLSGGIQSMIFSNNQNQNSLQGLSNTLNLAQTTVQLINLPALDNISYFQGIDTIYDLKISFCPLIEDLQDFTSSEQIDRILIENMKITSLEGLPNKEYFKTLHLKGNYNLSSFLGLNDSLVIEAFILENNGAFESLESLPQGTIITDSLSLIDNKNLAFCIHPSICMFVRNHPGRINIVSNQDGCNSESQILEACISSNDDIQPLDFRIRPNPTSGIIEIQTNTNIPFDVMLYDGLGRSYPFSNQGQIDISSLQSGLYYLKITTESKSKSYKIIKI